MKSQTYSRPGDLLKGLSTSLLAAISHTPTRIMWVLVALFVFSRAVSLMSFPIFNDESIYLQYSQVMASDFAKFKFISMDNIFRDWKPPLQYWLGSLCINFFESPLVSGRLVSLVVSLLGFYGVYSFASFAYNRTTALIVGMLYLICPPVLFYNNPFVAETYVFSFGAVYYALLLKTFQSKGVARRALLTVGTMIFASAIILTKQSGMLYLYLSPLVAFIPEKPKRLVGYAWRLATVSGVIAVALFLYRLIIPAAVREFETRFTGFWTLTIPELLRGPFGAWRDNGLTIYGFYRYYYTFFAALFILWFVIRAFSDRRRKDVVMSFLFLGASVAMLFGLRGFNEYIYNTSVILFLIVILGRVVHDLLVRLSQDQKSIRDAATLFVGCTLMVLMMGHWLYQNTLITIAPADYIRRSSNWMRNNYLSTWATGFGVQEAVDFLRSKEGPGTVFVDPQWGNPGTSLIVFQKSYPNIQAVHMNHASLVQFRDGADAPNLPELVDQIVMPTTQELTPTLTQRFVIFSSRGGGERDEWMHVVITNYCNREWRITAEPEQPPIVVCEF